MTKHPPSALVAAVVLGLFAMWPHGAFAMQEPSGLGAATVRPICERHPDVDGEAAETAPAALVDAIGAALADNRLTGLRLDAQTPLAARRQESFGDGWRPGVALGVSVWIEGYGEITAVNPDLQLLPASNQKILTAMGALDYLGAEAVMETTVMVTGLLTGGVLDGDLYLVGGGDPTLRRNGDHSIEALAQAVRQAGIVRILGDIVIDESRYDRLRTAPGWPGMPIPTWVGSLSALMVDQNRTRSDWRSITEPALVNGHRFAGDLAAAGVARSGQVRLGTAPDEAVSVASLASPPVRHLVRVIMEDSDNTVAEMLVKEIGLATHGVGSTESGLAALEELSISLCMPPAVLQYDGSGLSRTNARSARDWRGLLHAAQDRSWWPELVEAMAVAGTTGTISGRFLGTPAAGNLRAKTGTIQGVRALSGLMTTTGGRRVVFSAIVHHPDPAPAIAAIDDLLVAIATDQS